MTNSQIRCEAWQAFLTAANALQIIRETLAGKIEPGVFLPEEMQSIQASLEGLEVTASLLKETCFQIEENSKR